ncbi:fluoride efflux transporter CrcB [bacterium]|nr:MAG: fluoride efflux transporter CrcB [bacterium]
MNVLYLSAGGVLGTLSRYFLGGIVQRWAGLGFPYGTFFVNLSGCFVIGFAATLAGDRLHSSAPLRSFFFVGFLGAYTTFSTYMFESFKLLQEGRLVLGTAYLLGSVALGMLGLWLGVLLARWF